MKTQIFPIYRKIILSDNEIIKETKNYTTKYKKDMIDRIEVLNNVINIYFKNEKDNIAIPLYIFRTEGEKEKFLEKIKS